MKTLLKQFSALYFSLSLSASAQYLEILKGDKEFLNSLKEINGITNKGVSSPICADCNQSIENKDDLMCKDLFAATCLGTNDQNNYKEATVKMELELKNIVIEARNMAANSYGYKDIYTHIKKELTDQGILPRANTSDKDLQKLIDNDFKEENEEENKESRLFESAFQCRNQMKSITANDKLSFEHKKVEFQKVLEKFNEEIVFNYAKNLQFFITSHISNKCSTLKRDKKAYILENNSKIFSICASYSKIKNEAISLFKKEGSPEYFNLARAFVKKYYSEELVSGKEIKKDEDKYYSEFSCIELETVLMENTKKVINDLTSKYAKSKPVINHLIDNIYSADKKQKAFSLFDAAKKEVINLVPKVTNASQKRTLIKKGYDELTLQWLNKPSDQMFEKIETSKVESLKKSENLIDEYDMFLDGSLSFFKEVNAYYSPPIVNSNKENLSIERVHMMPSFLKELDRNPLAFYVVVAHEVAHKIGPEVSKINGHNLKNEWSDLLKCYSNEDSINLIEGQEDETIADYVSSVALANFIQKLPVTERKSALKAAMKIHCAFDAMEEEHFGFNCEGGHPNSRLRVAGIYGGNSKIRKMIGCENKKSDFRTCDLKSEAQK